ncbi:hypothetical protein Spb1_15800 [Planctopirus ephydatiae]|uniref:Uncharacterized protein n=1 Tax=Planctopirus ephydatiae TaxID=2528019 RepID=A0A518GM78_9PLAN|nr:hypothetical protein [Planctopirus ephydatiae]QDV29666.1 hypothetical protein Spb1_15800 [Planctopirus ephydatiae]
MKPFRNSVLTKTMVSWLLPGCMLLSVVNAAPADPSEPDGALRPEANRPVATQPDQPVKSSATGLSPQQLSAELLKQIDQSEAALRSAKPDRPRATAEPPASSHQKNSIELLNKLIQQLEQQSENSDTPGGSPENNSSPANPDASTKPESGKSQGQSSENESSRQQKETTTKDQAAKSDASQQGSSQKQGDNQNANEAEAGNRERERLAKEAARKRQLEVDVWGHLPDTVRGELLNSFDERILPSYERLVKKYYEALAEAQPASGGANGSSSTAADSKSPAGKD